MLTESPAAGSGAMRLKFLDGLRAVALLMVLVRHFYVRAYSLGLPPWSRALGLGYLGVSLFLLLSGFCVSWAYLGPKGRRFSLLEFARLRATRILPAYYVAVAIGVAITAGSSTPREISWQVFTHVLLIHNWFPSTVMGLVGPFWSLALECQLYVLFPLLFWGFKRFGAWWTLAAVAAAQTTFRAYALRFGTEYNDLTFVLPWSVAGRIFDFTLGMLAAFLVSHGAHTSRWRAAWPAIAVFGLPLALLAKSRFGVTHPLTDALWALSFFAVVLWAATGRWLHALLSYGPLVWLGVASYSAYLVHEMAMPVVFAVLLRWDAFAHHPLYLAPLALALTLVPCFVFFYLVEQPAMKWFKKRKGQAGHRELTLG